MGDNSIINLPNTSDEMNTSIMNLEAELHKQAENCEKMSLSIKRSEIDLKKKDEEIIQQQNKVHQFKPTALEGVCLLFVNKIMQSV